jgi:hypothetical protein
VDCSGSYSPVHVSLDELKALPRDWRHRIVCMHVDSSGTIEQAKSAGFLTADMFTIKERI